MYCWFLYEVCQLTLLCDLLHCMLLYMQYACIVLQWWGKNANPGVSDFVPLSFLRLPWFFSTFPPFFKCKTFLSVSIFFNTVLSFFPDAFLLFSLIIIQPKSSNPFLKGIWQNLSRYTGSVNYFFSFRQFAFLCVPSPSAHMAALKLQSPPSHSSLLVRRLCF